MPTDNSMKSKYEIEYEGIVWENINLSSKTPVIGTLRKIKNYYWEKYQRTGIKTMIVPGTNDFTFVHNAFSKWHNSWDEKTQGDIVVAFYVDMAEDLTTQCFHYKLKNLTLKHNDLGWTKGFKSPEQAIKEDINDACRNVIKDYKEGIRRSMLNTFCPITNEILTIENSVVHHDGMLMHQIIEAWVESKGGYKKLSRYINSVMDGTKTLFTKQDLIDDFFRFHNEMAKLIVITKEAHKQIHSTKK